MLRTWTKQEKAAMLNQYGNLPHMPAQSTHFWIVKNWSNCLMALGSLTIWINLCGGLLVLPLQPWSRELTDFSSFKSSLGIRQRSCRNTAYSPGIQPTSHPQWQPSTMTLSAQCEQLISTWTDWLLATLYELSWQLTLLSNILLSELGDCFTPHPHPTP